MRIAIDISPLSSGHKVRGVGFYVKLLSENLESIDKKNKYVFFEGSKIPKEVDIVHYPYFDPFFITLPKILPKKTVVTVHDLTPIVFKKHFPAGIRGKIKWLIQKNRLNRTDYVIADSECSKRDIEKLVGIGGARVKVVYLGVNGSFKPLASGTWRVAIKKKYGLPENFLLYVGDATWNKNLPRLIEAVRKTKHKLVLVGKVWSPTRLPAQRASSPEGRGEVQPGLRPGGEVSNNLWNNDLREVLKEIENDDQFIKLGFVPDEDIVKIYNIATASIMPSIYEGFGLPVLEAMSCGCPVISSRGGSLPEVGGDAVFYVDDKDTESIKSGINKLFEDKELREEFSKKGIIRAKKFSIKKMVEQTIEVYEIVSKSL